MIRLSSFLDEAADSLDGQIRAAQDNGLRFTDIRIIDKKSVMNFTVSEAESYVSTFARAGIGAACIASALGKTDVCSYEDISANLEHVLLMCKIFGCDRVRIFSFYNAAGQGGRVLECLKRMAERAAREHVYLYHENELGIYGATAESCLEIIKNTGCRCIYDPANFVLAGEDITLAEKLLLPFSDFFHLKDARYSGEIVPAGYGDAGLDRLSYSDGLFVTIEPHLYEFGGLGGLSQHTLIRSEEFSYNNQREAFDAGVTAVKALLRKKGVRTI